MATIGRTKLILLHLAFDLMCSVQAWPDGFQPAEVCPVCTLEGHKQLEVV